MSRNRKPSYLIKVMHITDTFFSDISLHWDHLAEHVRILTAYFVKQLHKSTNNMRVKHFRAS